MVQPKPFNLFVYGTLMNPSVFRAVIGKRLTTVPADAADPEAALACDATLDGYKKVSPDSTYLYAVPDPHERISGYMIGPLPPESMLALRKYEGRNYCKRTVQVQTRYGLQKAIVFLGNLKVLEHSFGYGFHDPFKQEILLREKIEKALIEAQQEQLHTADGITRRAIAELHGSTIRDLVRRHFEAGGIGDYVIKQSLKGSQLRDFQRVAQDPEAQALAKNYLALVLRQVMFNQIEDRIRQDFRYELDKMDLGTHYYERTISSLVALRMLNAATPLCHILSGDALSDIPFKQSHLLDYVSWAVVAADAVYEPRTAKLEMADISGRMNRGHIPLGAELEFSNIGNMVIDDPAGATARDAVYDGFLYFNDFALDVLTWKLGGHIDDHHEKASKRPRRGFFEVALGSLSIEANLSKPITDDPWLLNQIIHEARRFYPIRPHSVHMSMQLRSQNRPVRDRPLPLHIMKCLFALAGDPAPDEAGKIVITRLVSREIVRSKPTAHLHFSQISRRTPSEADDLGGEGRPQGRYVQQFKFLRLSPSIDYEPLIMGLKGLQLSLTPGSFLTAAQFKSSPRLRELFVDLLAWGAAPQPIAEDELDSFLGNVYDGLSGEQRGKPAHAKAYISSCLKRLKGAIQDFNRALGQGAIP
jgi:hypothetical protein